MKTVRNVRDLKEYGINGLTGEACGVGMRLLCDIGPKAERILGELFGGVQFVKTAWNGQDGAKKSAMLPHSLFADIAAYCLLSEDGFDVVITRPDFGLATGFSREEWEKIRAGTGFSNLKYSRIYAGKGTAGMRNRHEMSGRIA